MKKQTLLANLLLFTIILSACSKVTQSEFNSPIIPSPQESTTQEAQVTSPPTTPVIEETPAPTPAQIKELTQQEIEVEKSGDAEFSAILMSPDNKLLANIEWYAGNGDVKLPLKFDDIEAELILGLNSPNGTKIQVVFPSVSRGYALDTPIDEMSEVFDEYDELHKSYSLQAGLHDFDKDGVKELVVVAGDRMTDCMAWVYSFDSTTDISNSNPIKLKLSAFGQATVILDENEISLPFGSQGLSDTYSYSKNIFTHIN